MCKYCTKWIETVMLSPFVWGLAKYHLFFTHLHLLSIFYLWSLVWPMVWVDCWVREAAALEVKMRIKKLASSCGTLVCAQVVIQDLDSRWMIPMVRPLHALELSLQEINRISFNALTLINWVKSDICSKKAPERVQASTSSCRLFVDYFKTSHTDTFVFSQESRNH